MTPRKHRRAVFSWRSPRRSLPWSAQPHSAGDQEDASKGRFEVLIGLAIIILGLAVAFFADLPLPL